LARASDLPAGAAVTATASTFSDSFAPPRSSDPNWSAVAAEPPRRRAPEADTSRMETAPALDGFGLYPESLQASMRAAKDIGFAGATAELPPRSGAFRAFDPKGVLVPVSGQDLIILRVTPDMIDGLPERMANIRRAAPGLKRMIAVFNGAQARHSEPASPLAPIDLTPEGIRAALWRSGFAVTGERPYRGFPNGTKDGDILQGWMQVEAIPRVMDRPTEKLVSIIILGFNQVEYTRKCIESIRMHTRQRYELILIDNGSKDGTEAYFRSIPGAKVVRNAENLGVSKGWNQGLRLARGEYLLILNNDIIVGPDWLENMVRLAECDPSIGLVGPRSNYIAGPQVVPNVPYRAESEIQGFIRAWQAGHDLSAAEFQFIKGFCHLIPRRVFEKVGFYDERFGKGNFEDDDYCMRVRLHGFRALFADDSFIHHYGSVSFNQDSVDWRALMIENQGKYERKWAKGAEALHDTQVSDPQAIIAPQAPQSPMPHNAAPSKLEQGRLAYERGDLERARGLFLQAQAESPNDPEAYCSLGVLMFSSGSVQDATSFFMRCLNLRPDHIDAAENLLECLAQRSGKASEGEMAALASRYPSNPVFRAGHSASSAAPAPSAPGASAPSAENTLAVKSLPAWRQEVEALIEARKYVPAVDLLEARLRANADAGICHNYLGIIAHSCGDAEMALRNFAAALRHAPGDADILFNYSDTLIAVGRCAEAATLLEDAARATLAAGQADPDAPDLAATAEQIRHAISKGAVDGERLLASRDANQSAEKLMRMGPAAEAAGAEAAGAEAAGAGIAGAEADEAKALLEAALLADPEDFRALNNLGLLAWYRHDGAEAWRHFQRCLSVRPTWTDALLNAFDTALALGDMGLIQPCLDRALAQAPDHPQALAMRRHIQAQNLAIHHFKNFEGLEANAAALARAETALDQDRKGDAIRIYLEALQIQPQNPQAFNGLGIIAFAEKRYPDAFGLFEAASGLHPMDQDILMNLWQCAQALRRESDVLPKLQHSLERNPALEDVRAVVKEFA
jgi:GT2 family glycosyltransferase/Flp pilus assembly protein TadD